MDKRLQLVLAFVGLLLHAVGGVLTIFVIADSRYVHKEYADAINKQNRLYLEKVAEDWWKLSDIRMASMADSLNRVEKSLVGRLDSVDQRLAQVQSQVNDLARRAPETK